MLRVFVLLLLSCLWQMEANVSLETTTARPEQRDLSSAVYETSRRLLNRRLWPSARQLAKKKTTKATTTTPENAGGEAEDGEQDCIELSDALSEGYSSSDGTATTKKSTTTKKATGGRRLRRLATTKKTTTQPTGSTSTTLPWCDQDDESEEDDGSEEAGNPVAGIVVLVIGLLTCGVGFRYRKKIIEKIAHIQGKIEESEADYEAYKAGNQDGADSGTDSQNQAAADEAAVDSSNPAASADTDKSAANEAAADSSKPDVADAEKNWICPKCGHTPSPGAKFCGKCGLKRDVLNKAAINEAPEPVQIPEANEIQEETEIKKEDLFEPV